MLEILTSILNGFSREFRLALSHVHSSMMSDAVADTKRGAFLLAMFAHQSDNHTFARANRYNSGYVCIHCPDWSYGGVIILFISPTSYRVCVSRHPSRHAYHTAWYSTLVCFRWRHTVVQYCVLNASNYKKLRVSLGSDGDRETTSAHQWSDDDGT